MPAKSPFVAQRARVLETQGVSKLAPVVMGLKESDFEIWQERRGEKRCWVLSLTETWRETGSPQWYDSGMILGG